MHQLLQEKSSAALRLDRECTTEVDGRATATEFGGKRATWTARATATELGEEGASWTARASAELAGEWASWTDLGGGGGRKDWDLGGVAITQAPFHPRKDKAVTLLSISAARRTVVNQFAGDDGAVRDAPAVRPGQHYREADDDGRGPLRREGAQGHAPGDPVRDAPPRRGGVGRGRRRVRPAPVPGHGVGRAAAAAGLLPGPTVLHREGLRDAGGQGDAGADRAAVRLRGGAGVRARAGRPPDCAAVERAPRRAQALGGAHFGQLRH